MEDREFCWSLCTWTLGQGLWGRCPDLVHLGVLGISLVLMGKRLLRAELHDPALPSAFKG